MPYITNNSRDARRFDCVNPESLKERAVLLGNSVSSSAELNYAITVLFQQYLRAQGLKYSTIADILAASKGSIAEFQRKIVDPYEAVKEEENGGVYWDVTMYS